VVDVRGLLLVGVLGGCGGVWVIFVCWWGVLFVSLWVFVCFWGVFDGVFVGGFLLCGGWSPLFSPPSPTKQVAALGLRSSGSEFPGHRMTNQMSVQGGK